MGETMRDLAAENRKLAAELDELRRKHDALIREHDTLKLEFEKVNAYWTSVDALDLGVVITNPNVPGNPLIACNAKFLELSGYTRDQVMGRNCRFLQKDDRDQPELEKIRTAVREGTRAEVLLRNYRKNGELFWNSLTIEPVRGTDGGILYFVGALSDVTKEVEKSDTIARTNQRFHALFHEAPEAIILASAVEGKGGGFVLSANSAAESIHGYDEGEMERMPLESMAAAGNAFFTEAQVDRLEGGERLQFRSRHQRKDGSVFPVEVHASYIEFENRRCVLSFVSDTTIQEKLESEIRLAAERSDLALAVENDGFYDWDLNTQDVYFDKRYYTMAGYAPDEFPGNFREWAARVHEDDFVFVKHALDRLVKGETEEYDQEFRYRTKNGDWMWIRSRAMVVAVDEKGNPVRIIGTHRDITHRILTENELKKANEELRVSRDKAKSADKAKSEFLSVISHEMRTPLNPILGFSELLRSEIEDPESLELVDEIRGGAYRMLNLVNTILMYIEEDETPQTKVQDVFCIQKVVGELLEGFRGQAVSKGIELELVEREQEQRVATDRASVRTVLEQLLSNALKFTKEGYVRVELGFVKGSKGEDLLVIQVMDTGIGIAKENHWKVFEPFMQVDSSLTRSHEGIGLGMPLSKKLVESMNGWIGIESEEGKGTKVTVRIPVLLQEKEPKQQVPVDACFLGFRGKRILLVDDDSSNLELVRHLFAKAECNVVLAKDGLEAVEHASKLPFDLILMDLRMPFMDGFEATRKIRENSSLNKNTCIIAATAQADAGTHEKCIESGMNDSILKPYDLAVLKSKLAGTLDL